MDEYEKFEKWSKEISEKHDLNPEWEAWPILYLASKIKEG